MKQTNTKIGKELKLDRRLALVRTTVRELNPNQLQEAHGGGDQLDYPTCSLVFTAVAS